MKEQSDPVSCHRGLDLYELDTKRSWQNSNAGRGFTLSPKMLVLNPVDAYPTLVEMDKHAFLLMKPYQYGDHMSYFIWGNLS